MKADRPGFLQLTGAILALALAASACAPPLPRGSPIAALPAPVAAEAGSAGADLLEIVRVLAAPEMGGRQAGTPGADRAAAFIAEQFAAAGLRPGGDAGTYLQGFDVPAGVRLGEGNSLALGKEGAPLVAGKDFVPFGFSDDGAASGDVVFVGYGITAPELNYDDYAGVDVRGKVVLALTHEPRERDPRSPFRAPAAYRYTEARYKAINAREHGARAIILVADPLGHPGGPEELFAIKGISGSPSGIIALNATRRVADEALSALGTSLADLQREIDASLAPRPRPLPGVSAGISVSLVRPLARTANVVGILPGTDPALRETAVVIGAHYDHLGIGGETSLAPARYGEVHPGADDNASGVAGVIAMARAFAASGGAGRTLVFVAFSGEEMGLLGSTHFVNEPAVPLRRTVAMLNMDMIGRLRDGTLYVSGTGTGREFQRLLEEANRGIGLTLKESEGGYGPSDHTPFYAKDRPVLFFFTGPHEDYHRPTDTVDKINAEGTARVARLIYRVAAAIAEAPAPITFARVQGERPPEPAGHPAASPYGAAAGSRGAGYGPYFGSIPDFSYTQPGVKLGGVRSGSPAEKAGLRSGDVIVRFGGVTIRNLEDMTFALRARRPGEEVEVVYVRDGKELTATAVLERRN